MSRVSATPDDPLSVPAPDLDLDALPGWVEEHWGLAGDLTALHGERDRNFRLDSGAERHLLKVHNPADPESVLDLQGAALGHLRSVAPELPVPRVVPTRDGRTWLRLPGRDGRTSFAWVMTWLEGRHPDPAELDDAHLRDWGRTSARLGRGLRGFAHPAATHPVTWDVQRLPRLRPWLDAVAADRRPAVEAVLDRFDRHVAPVLPRLRAQVVHNDLAPTNVLVDDRLALTGITDFGDMTHTALVCDLAIAAADLLSGREGALALAQEVVDGYHAVTPLEPEELALLPDLMAARYAATVLITAWRTREQGWAPEIDDEAHSQLEAMLTTGLDRPLRRPGAAYHGRAGRSTEALAAARARTFGGQELSYDRPLHLVRGEGVLLEAADGRRYLDAYNNVPVLGHSHPAVVSAVSAQLATLNTNSRYLQDAPVELAERLLATMPDRFDRVLLVSSGSEANDLAWRIARHATGHRGGIATAWAYHGVTEATWAFSPESWLEAEPPAHMALVRPPPAAGPGVAEAVAALAASGHGVAADDGRRRLHQRRGARPGARVDPGGGAGRPRRRWPVRRRRGAGGPRTHRRAPVELRGRRRAGRPGHPRQADGQRLPGRRGRRAGRAGRPVRGRHRLVQHLRRQHRRVRRGAGRAAHRRGGGTRRAGGRRRRPPPRGPARGGDRSPRRGGGAGLGAGPGRRRGRPGDRAPGRRPGGRIVEGMRERGVLIGRTGRDRATLKVRPPLVFGDEHVEVLASALEATVADLG